MPIRTHIPNIEAIRAEIAALEEQRGILKSPEMIGALKAEIAGLIAQRLKALAEIDEANARLANIKNEQTQAVLVEIAGMKQKAGIEVQKVIQDANNEASQILSEQERIEGLIGEARTELAGLNGKAKIQEEAISGMLADLTSQKKAADKYISMIMDEASEKGKELDARRTAYIQEFKNLQDALAQDRLNIEKTRAEQDARQRALDITGEQYARQILAQEEKERDFLKQQQDFKQRQADIATEHESQVAKLREMQAMLASTSKALAEIQAEMDNKAKELTIREDLLKQKEADLVPKWDEILKREADLETNWKVYKKQKQTLDYKLRELE